MFSFSLIEYLLYGKNGLENGIYIEPLLLQRCLPLLKLLHLTENTKLLEMLGKVDLAIGQVVAVSDMHKSEILQDEATGKGKN